METDTKIDSAKLEIWRESLAHLRYLSDEVWKRFQLFLWLDLIFFLLKVGVWRKSIGGCCFVLLAALGIAFIGRYILKRNRIYYLQMLARKSLLEDELGFYATKFSGTGIDFAFPWRLAPEAVAEIKKDFNSWVQKSIRPEDSIARWLFIIYEGFIGVCSVALIVLLIRLFK